MLRKDRWAALMQDLKVVGIDCTPMNGSIRDVGPSLAARVGAAMLKLPASKRRLTSADVIYDIVLVGAGVHAAAFIYTLRQSRPDLRILVVERSEAVCSTFSKLGDKGFVPFVHDPRRIGRLSRECCARRTRQVSEGPVLVSVEPCPSV